MASATRRVAAGHDGTAGAEDSSRMCLPKALATPLALIGAPSLPGIGGSGDERVAGPLSSAVAMAAALRWSGGAVAYKMTCACCCSRLLVLVVFLRGTGYSPLAGHPCVQR